MRQAIVNFESVPVRYVDIGAERWISAIDVAKSLGYDNPSRAVSDMLRAHQELFKGYEKIVSLGTDGGAQKSKVLNLKGVIAFCIKSNQKTAIRFQRWAIDVIEKKMSDIPSEIRMIARAKRVRFTDTLRDRGCSNRGHYVKITKDMKDGLGIDKEKPKDACDLIEVMKIAASEDIARINMIENDAKGFVECHTESVKAAKNVKAITAKRNVEISQ